MISAGDEQVPCPWDKGKVAIVERDRKRERVQQSSSVKGHFQGQQPQIQRIPCLQHSEELALAVKPGSWQRESSVKNVPEPKLQRLRGSGQGIEAWCGSVGIQQWSHGC